MSNKILTSITAAALSATCFAEDIPALSITTASDSTIICLKNISKIKYNDTKMIVLQKDGSENSIDMDNILSMHFSNIDGNDLFPSALIATEGFEDERTILYDLNGLVKSNTDKKGIYIIKSGKEPKKKLK